MMFEKMLSNIVNLFENVGLAFLLIRLISDYFLIRRNKTSFYIVLAFTFAF